MNDDFASFYDADYYERGAETQKSLYSNYRWMPELTIPMCYHLIDYCHLKGKKVLDFGCAKGYSVYALRLLDIDAYGVDVSQYAIQEAIQEAKNYIKCINPCDPLDNFDWVICKDVLEHVPYEMIDQQLKVFNQTCDNIFVIVPLGDGKKYYVDSYELDKSHFIREELEWWQKKLTDAGYSNVSLATKDTGPFKRNWNFNPNANGLLMAHKN